MNGGESDMRTEPSDEAVLVPYLLGRLTEPELGKVEDRAFGDAAFLEALKAAEADLIDCYVRGELSPEDRRAFEGRFFDSPQRRRKVEFARALARLEVPMESAVSQPVSAWQSLLLVLRSWQPPLRLAVSAALLLAAAGALWISLQNGAMRSRIAVLEDERLRAEDRERSLRQELAAKQPAGMPEQQPAPSKPAQTEVAVLILLPGLPRGATRLPELVIGPATPIAHIEIHLEPRDEYPRFRADLHTRSGDEVMLRGNLRANLTAGGISVTFDVASSALLPGEYELALRGISGSAAADIGYYYFRVSKK